MKPYELHLATRDCDLSGSERAVLREVAMYAGEDGICFASQQSIGEALDMPDRTVRRELASLVELKVLVEVESPKRTKAYRIDASAIPRPGARPGFTPNRSRGRAPRPAGPASTPAGSARRQAVPGGRECQVADVADHPGRECQSDRQAVPVTLAGPADDQIHDPIPDPIREESARARPPAPPDWAVGWPDTPPQEVVDDVCAILAAVRGRAVRPTEAGTEQGLVREALQRTADSLPELLAQVELVARWARESPDGRDELGGIRARTGERWGPARHQTPRVVLGERWGDWLDAARRWDAGRVATATAPPLELAASPLEEATAAYGDSEAEARLTGPALEMVRRWKVADGAHAVEEAAK